MDRACKKCDGTMEGRHPTAVFCSPECKRLFWNNYYLSQEYKDHIKKRDSNNAEAHTKRLERSRKRREEIKQDPEALAQQQEYNRNYNRTRLQIMRKEDPEAYAEYLKKHNDDNQMRRERVKQDPIEYEKWLEKHREEHNRRRMRKELAWISQEVEKHASSEPSPPTLCQYKLCNKPLTGPRKYCDHQCMVNENHRYSNEQTKIKLNAEPRYCTICGEPMPLSLHMVSSRLTCSEECRRQYYKEKDRKRREKQRAKRIAQDTTPEYIPNYVI